MIARGNYAPMGFNAGPAPGTLTDDDRNYLLWMQGSLDADTEQAIAYIEQEGKFSVQSQLVLDYSSTAAYQRKIIESVF